MLGLGRYLWTIQYVICIVLPSYLPDLLTALLFKAFYVI